MEIVESKLAGVKLVKPKVFGDHRGFFMESYNEKAFHEAGIDMKFIQDNHSLSVEAG
ncbi:dTDP-4-dehydrorhamnose 3,5-epimerase family protein, partial [Listeria monocytogenes]